MSPATDRPLPSRDAGSADEAGPQARASSGPRASRPLRSSRAPAPSTPLTGEEAGADGEPSLASGSSDAASDQEEGEKGGSTKGGAAAGGGGSNDDDAADDDDDGDADKDADEDDEEEDDGEKEGKASGGKKGSLTAAELAARRQTEFRKSISRFILFFMGFMGLYMLIDTGARNSIALTLGLLLAPALGFNGKYLLATMFLTAALEMGLSALAYHFTTDWIETATVQHHQASIRPLWMKAVRGQKKEHMEALKPHMDSLNMRQSKVTIAQLKGMVITWVLLIAIYTWVGIYIADQCPKPVIDPSHSQIVNPMVGSFLLNATVASGHGPYNYTWWMQGTADNGPVNGENATGPSGPNAVVWSFSPPASGVYLITLRVTDARGSVGWGFQGLQYYTQSPAPTTTAPPPSCKGTSLLMFGTEANLMGAFGPFPLWFAAFSLYTVPLNLIFRRYLKHVALSQRLPEIEEAHVAALAPLAPLGSGGSGPGSGLGPGQAGPP